VRYWAIAPLFDPRASASSPYFLKSAPFDTRRDHQGLQASEVFVAVRLGC
jgi:hypothetical protein